MLTTILCAALTAAGLGVALQTAYRRRFLRATRIAALALLPFGLALAGLVTLGRRIGTAVADWAADLVLKSTVWTGFTVLACSALLYGITRLFSGRGPDGSPGADAAAGPGGAGGERDRGRRETAPATLPGGPAPALPAGRTSGKRRASADSGLSDFADVEEILRRRGI